MLPPGLAKNVWTWLNIVWDPTPSPCVGGARLSAWAGTPRHLTPEGVRTHGQRCLGTWARDFRHHRRRQPRNAPFWAIFGAMTRQAPAPLEGFAGLPSRSRTVRDPPPPALVESSLAGFLSAPHLNHVCVLSDSCPHSPGSRGTRQFGGGGSS